MGKYFPGIPGETIFSANQDSAMQFPPHSEKVTDKHDFIDLNYDLGCGIFKTPHGYGAFKECGGTGFIHYSVSSLKQE